MKDLLFVWAIGFACFFMGGFAICLWVVRHPQSHPIWVLFPAVFIFLPAFVAGALIADYLIKPF